MLRARDLSRQSDRLVEVGRLDQIIAPQLFLRLRERTIGDHLLTVAHAHGGGGGRRHQGLATDDAVADFFSERIIGRHDRRVFFLSRRGVFGFVRVDQQHVAHGYSSHARVTRAMILALMPSTNGRRAIRQHDTPHVRPLGPHPRPPFRGRYFANQDKTGMKEWQGGFF